MPSLPFRSLAAAVCLLAATGVTAGSEREAVLELHSSVFGNTRNLYVLLPPSYHSPQPEPRRYPVFYFTDGVAAWHAWGVPDVVEALWAEGAIPEMIFVGIDNGGSVAGSTNPMRDRASEYIPYPDPTWTDDPPEPRGSRFPQFLFDEVMPRIDREYRTQTGAEHTGLAGDSFAGAAALHTALRHPDRLGYLLLESPSLHVGDGQLLRDAAAADRWPRAVYLGVGTAEGDTPEIQRQMVSNVRRLHRTIGEAAEPPRLHLLVAEGATHWYDAWKARLPEALRFLLAAQPKDQ